jgi:lactoylglutathione lyase
MARATEINHVTLIVDDLERASQFYEQELGLERLPTFKFDYPAQFFRINDTQQLHLSEWPDTPSFRGHVCLRVDDFTTVFQRMRARDAIDITPWGKVRRLPDGAMQMFVRDPAGNLLEISCRPDTPIDEAIFDDELVDAGVGLYVSNRNDARGTQSADATLYHGDEAR